MFKKIEKSTTEKEEKKIIKPIKTFFFPEKGKTIKADSLEEARLKLK